MELTNNCDFIMKNCWLSLKNHKILQQTVSRQLTLNFHFVLQFIQVSGFWAYDQKTTTKSQRSDRNVSQPQVLIFDSKFSKNFPDKASTLFRWFIRSVDKPTFGEFSLNLALIGERTGLKERSEFKDHWHYQHLPLKLRRSAWRLRGKRLVCLKYRKVIIGA